MLEPIVPNAVVRRYLVVSEIESLDIDRIVDGLLVQMPVEDVLDEIADLFDDHPEETDILQDLVCCANADDLLTHADATWDPESRAHAALIEAATRLLAKAGITFKQWLEARNG